MKPHLTAAEMVGLPGLPTDETNVRRTAKRCNWIGRRRAGSKAVEYSFEVLPPPARIAYLSRTADAIDVPAPVARDAAAEPEAVNVAGSAAEARDARLAILALADKVAADAGTSRKQTDLLFCDLYNAGNVSAPAWVTVEVKSLTPRTLRRWRAFAAHGQKSRLAVDRSAARRGTGILDRANDGAVKTFILALVVKQPQLTAHDLRGRAADQFPDLTLPSGEVVPLPPIRTFQHALKAWRNEYRNAIESIRDPDGYKSKVRFAARVAVPATRLNEIWQIDASPSDVMTTDGRVSVYVCVDIYSRRMIGFVSRTARAAAVGQLIRKAMLAWGKPERIKTDNGSDFVAHRTKRLFDALGIEHELAPPFQPERKGHVERAIGTMQRGLMRTLPGFIGHSVADRKVIENRKAFSARLGEKPEDMFEVSLSAIDLQRHLDDWCKDIYATHPHAGLKGRTPFAVAAMAGGVIQKIEDARALDVLLAPVAGKDGIRQVTKTGLRVGGEHYMAGWMNVGDRVLVRMDESDLGRVFVFSEDGETYLGDALAPDLAGLDPIKTIAAVRAEQKRRIDDAMAPVKREARKIKSSDIAAALHRQALRDAGTLIEFPKREVEHTTPAIQAAAAAARGHKPAPEHSPDVLALQAALLAGETSSIVKPLRAEETAHQRWNRARDLEGRVARGEFVDAEQLMWLGAYREGSEYRGFAKTYGVSLTQENGPVAAEPLSQSQT